MATNLSCEQNENLTSVDNESVIEIFVESNSESLNPGLQNECHCTLEELNSAGITDIQKLTLAQYNALSQKVSTVLYLICN